MYLGLFQSSDSGIIPLRPRGECVNLPGAVPVFRSWDHSLKTMTGLPRVREMSGKNKIFSRSGNFGHFTHVRELSGNFMMSCQGIVREFYHDINFRLKLPSFDKGSTWVVFM